MMDTVVVDDHQCGAYNILELPAPLQVDLFTKWMQLKDIGALDRALCSTRLREPFMNAWRQEYCTFLTESESPLHLSSSLAAWLADRKIRTGCGIMFDDEAALSKSVDKFFRSVSGTLQKLTYSEFMASTFRPMKRPGTVKGFVKKVGLCSELTSLQLAQVPMQDGDLRKVLTKCSKLKMLEFYFAHKIDFNAIHECGKALEELKISNLRPLGIDEDGLFGTETREIEYPYVENNKTNTLRKFTFKDAGHREDWGFLGWYIIQNAGLQDLFIDCLDWYSLREIIQNCHELVTLRAYIPLPYGGFHWGLVEEQDQSAPILEDAEDLRVLMEQAKSIRYLHLSQNRRLLLTEGQFLELLKSCPQYVVLSLADMFDGEEMWLEKERLLPVPVKTAFPASATHGLQVLHMRKISLNALHEVFDLCPHLAEVGIQKFDTTNTLAQTLALLVQKKVRRVQVKVKKDGCAELSVLTGLDFLHLFGSDELTNEDLLVIARNNPDLTHLRVRECKQITTQYLKDIMDACPKLETLHMCAGEHELPKLGSQLKKKYAALKHVHLAVLIYKK